MTSPYIPPPPVGQQSAADVDRWNRYVEQIQQAMQAATGSEDRWRREQLRSQLRDAERGRQNAYRIAQLQAETSRYGTDAQRQTELARLQETQRQFDQTHALDMRRFGLDERRVGQDDRRISQDDRRIGQDDQRIGLDRQRVQIDATRAATDYLSTPDRFIQAGMVVNGVTRALTGQGGPAPLHIFGDPKFKTMADYAVLTGQGPAPAPAAPAQPPGGGMTRAPAPPPEAPPTVGPDGLPMRTPVRDVMGIAPPGNGPRAPVPAMQQPPQRSMQQAVAAGGPGADGRVKALQGMLKALPPSAGEGLDSNDFAVLSAANALYRSKIRPDQYARLGTSTQQILGSAGRRLGYDQQAWVENMQRRGIGQRSGRLA